MTVARTAGVCLVLAGIALAGPTFRIGTKLTWRGDAGSTVWYDDYGASVAEVSYGEEFGGPTIELSYGPVWGLSGRIDVAQVGFLFDGQAFRLFPMMGLDMVVEPPLDWRAKPYAWVGGSLGRYVRVPYDDFMPDAEVHLRAGLGAKLSLSRRVELLAEGLLYSHDSRANGYVRFVNGGKVRAVEEKPADLRLAGFEIGARFALGK